MHQQTAISAVGEFGLIDIIKRIVDVRLDDLTVHANLLRGIGDDAAIYRPTPGHVHILTTDTFVEGIHFDLTFTSFKHLGWKVIAASVSDVAAMGGIPRYATVAISLPGKISVEMVRELYEGMAHVCKRYNCMIVGGDTTTTLANTTIGVTLIGEADEHRVLYRSGARVGDYLCVTGHLGASVAGLKVLQREKDRFSAAASTEEFRPNLEPYAPAIEKHLMPKPRLDISRLLVEHVTVNAMIDVSDGLASDVRHICEQSGVGATVYEHNLPVERVTQTIASEFAQSPTTYALFGGEEYELLFSLSDEEYAKIEQLTSDVTIIGRITEPAGQIVLVNEQGEHVPLEAGGWDHFRSS
jgi:thiamine-monophosphate kinase